jgi:hypothetical protein
LATRWNCSSSFLSTQQKLQEYFKKAKARNRLGLSKNEIMKKKEEGGKKMGKSF